MSDMEDAGASQAKDSQLQNYVNRLLKLATPNTADIMISRIMQYVDILTRVVGRERVYIVGSTGENTKLRWSTDAGDIDILMVSGKLQIPVENLEHREAMPVYVWVRATHLDPRLCGELVDGKYMAAEILRGSTASIFTSTRALYTMHGATQFKIHTNGESLTVFNADSKVGIVRKEVLNLEIVGELKTNEKSNTPDSAKPSEAHLHKRWQPIRRAIASEASKASDIKLFKRLIDILAMFAKIPGVTRNPGGRFPYFHTVMHKLSEPQTVVDTNDMAEDDTHQPHDFDDVDNTTINRETENKVRATYTNIVSRDFVPALRIVGKLPCVETFLDRVKKAVWPSAELALEIYNTDVFLVCRRAPVDSVYDKDCCLSFNLAEIKLSQNLPGVAKNVFIVMKCYLKGAIKKKFKTEGRELKLKTYHIKMAMFWVCEKENLANWTDGSLLQAIQIVLAFLLKCVNDKCLLHYFVLSNLFVGFEKEDYRLLEECVHGLQSDPIRGIDHFFELDEQTVGEIMLSPAQAALIAGMNDEGPRLHPHKVEDGLIDILRGITEFQADEDGDTAVKDCIMEAFDMFIKDKRQADMETEQSISQSSQRSDTERGVEQPRSDGDAKSKNDVVTDNTSVHEKSARDRATDLRNWEFKPKRSDELGQSSTARDTPTVGLQEWEFKAKGNYDLGQDGSVAGNISAKLCEQFSHQRKNIERELRNAFEQFLTCSEDTLGESIARLKPAILAYVGTRKKLVKCSL